MRICCAGEVMVELAALDGSGQYQRGFAGDTFNTAVYLAREGLQVDYLTRLGDDPLSRAILAQLRAENISTGLVTLCQGRQPGLYLIDNDPDGERHFSYWRDQAPARQMFDDPLSLDPPDMFYFSGITLAIARSGQQQLLQLLEQLQAASCRIAFDPNYRPRLWDSVEQARENVKQILPYCHILLPTLEDETALWGFTSAEQAAAFYFEYGATECVIKGEALTTHVFAQHTQLSLQATPVDAIDTTGAGDSFNAGYLAARLQGQDLAESVRRAQALSARVVQHRGAILSSSTKTTATNSARTAGSNH